MTQDIYLNWLENHSVQNEALDSQHKQIFNAINELHALSKKNYSKEDLDMLLLTLEVATKAHFHFEETILDYSSFPDKESHKRFHYLMIQRLAKITIDLKAEPDKYNDLLQTIKEWWICHVCSEDQEYIPYIKELGL